jgi:hypothetical protein
MDYAAALIETWLPGGLEIGGRRQHPAQATAFDHFAADLSLPTSQPKPQKLC